MCVVLWSLQVCPLVSSSMPGEPPQFLGFMPQDPTNRGALGGGVPPLVSTSMPEPPQGHLHGNHTEGIWPLAHGRTELCVARGAVLGQAWGRSSNAS